MSTRGDSCVKRDVCTFYECGSTSDLCSDCGHYLAEAVNTSTNIAMDAISASEGYESSEMSRGVKCISRAFLAGVEWQKQHQ